MNVEVIDISVPIKEGMMVYPGDPEPLISMVKDMEGGDGYNISKIDMCLHAGTHIDVPSHIVSNGETIGQVDIGRYCGRCKVFDMGGIPSIKAEDIKNLDIQRDDRVLFKTLNSSYLRAGKFIEEYTYLDPSAARLLAQIQISLVGLDYLSVENFYSNDFETHKMLLGNGIIILESIDLSGVEGGEYYLVAAPIKVYDSEGAPVRALLLKLHDV